MDSNILNSTVNSFKNFLSSNIGQIDGKESSAITSLKEDMRHFLRLVKYSKDITLKDLVLEINDAIEELYTVIVIQLNAVEIESFMKEGKKPNKSSQDEMSNDNTTNRNKIIIENH